ncbi:MAG: PVC-type heme-binding CxxCH protein, partial [Verrucomicrobiota bacterium]
MKTLRSFLFLSLSAGLLLAQDFEKEAAKLQFHQWSGELNLPDPVSISLDDEGRAYVTQTQRRKIQDLDIRQHQEWIEADVALQTVEEKRAFFRRELAADHPKASSHTRDLNKDGVSDYRDLMVLSERIYRVSDKDGDGTADDITTYAEGFQTEVTGIAAGVLWHEGTVYSTIAPDVWALRDEDDDGTADSREIIATGFGLHIAYAGHDMHGLTVGPDGRIYWSIGDKGLSVVDQRGKRWHYPNQGAVLRCEPDGTNFEVFAHGLRNVQELAFDDFGNLFGVDNDADQTGEMERFVYIVSNMDAGWRCNFQYRKSDYNPWTEEHLWEPHQEGRPAYTIAPIRNYHDGPCGFVYNPGTALGTAWKDTFFLTGAPKGEQWAFQVNPAGASFEMVNSRTIAQGKALIGWNFGPDGALYAVDWQGGYPLNQTGSIWKIDVAEEEQHPLREETATLLAT